MTGSVIATHYSKYGKLLEGQEGQLMLDNNKIVGDIEKAEDVGNEGNTRDVGEAGNAGDAGDAGDTRDKEAGRGNERRD